MGLKHYLMKVGTNNVEVVELLTLLDDLRDIKNPHFSNPKIVLLERGSGYFEAGDYGGIDEFRSGTADAIAEFSGSEMKAEDYRKLRDSFRELDDKMISKVRFRNLKEAIEKGKEKYKELSYDDIINE